MSVLDDPTPDPTPDLTPDLIPAPTPAPTRLLGSLWSILYFQRLLLWSTIFRVNGFFPATDPPSEVLASTST